jgi:hypothetical protein
MTSKLEKISFCSFRLALIFPFVLAEYVKWSNIVRARSSNTLNLSSKSAECRDDHSASALLAQGF